MGPFGSNIKSENYVPKGIPVIRGKNIQNGILNEKDFVYLTEEKSNELKASNAAPGDILVVAQGNVGKVGYIPKDSLHKRYVISQNMMKITTDSKIANPLFVYYFLQSHHGQHEILKNKNPTGVPSIAQPLTSLRNISIPLPSIKEQNKITEVPWNLDKQIIELQNQNNLLENMVLSIFKSWFVDFDVHTEFVDSELGKIPEGWKIKKIQDLGKIVTGKTPPTKDKDNYGSDYPFITIPDMHKQIIVVRTERYISEKAKRNLENYILPPLSICVSCIATPGLVSITNQPSLTNQQINSIICNNKFFPYFVFDSLKEIKNEIIVMASGGTATPNLNKGDFSLIKIVVPSEPLIQKYHNLVEPIFNQVKTKCELIFNLEKMKDFLLPKLFSGEIKLN